MDVYLRVGPVRAPHPSRKLFGRGGPQPYRRHPAMCPGAGAVSASDSLMLAGVPCLPVSIAVISKMNVLGKPHGFLCNAQGMQFHDLKRVINHCLPQVFQLENAKQFRRHYGGKTFATIMYVIEQELDYCVHVQLIFSSPWVQQKQERIFITGFQWARLLCHCGILWKWFHNTKRQDEYSHPTGCSAGRINMCSARI